MATQFSLATRPEAGKPLPEVLPVDGAPRVGQVYLDVRRRRLHCLNDTARHLHKEGVPLTTEDLAQQPVQTLEGQTVAADAWPLIVAWREGRVVEATFTLHRIGYAPCRVQWTASPVREPNAGLVGVMGTVVLYFPEPDWTHMAGLAHDLRNPLHNLQLLSNLIDKPGASHKEALTHLRSATERALKIGHDLLEWCRNSGRRGRGVEPAWFSLEPFLASLAGMQTPAAERKGLTLTTDLEPARGWELYLDRNRLGRLLENLLVNAVRYTQRGQIRFSVGWRKDGKDRFLVLSVADTGVGIAPEEQESIFQEYERGKAGREVDSCGSGLGLAVVDRLVEELGLRLEMHSEFGHGSTFQLLIPSNLLRESPAVNQQAG